MTLHNYWWLLLWMFTGGFVLYIVFPKKKEFLNGRKEERWRILPALLLVLPYIVWAGFRDNSIGDTYSYQKMFMDAPGSLTELVTYMGTIKKDRGFSVLTVLIKSIIPDNASVYFLVIAAFQMLALVYVYRKYSCNLWMSLFLFIAAGEYISYMCNGIRQFTAIAIILLGTEFLRKKKYIPFILIVLLAATMHASALLMIPIMLIAQGRAWNTRTVVAILLSVAVLAFADKFTNLLDLLMSNTQYSTMVTDWKEWGDTGTNPIRVLIYCIPMILSVIGHKQIRSAEDSFVDMLVNLSAMTSALALISMVTSGIFMGRLIIYPAVYSTGLLLPWELENIFTKESSMFLKIVMLIGYIGFFYYQMHVALGMI